MRLSTKNHINIEDNIVNEIIYNNELYMEDIKRIYKFKVPNNVRHDGTCNTTILKRILKVENDDDLILELSRIFVNGKHDN